MTSPASSSPIRASAAALVAFLPAAALAIVLLQRPAERTVVQHVAAYSPARPSRHDALFAWWPGIIYTRFMTEGWVGVNSARPPQASLLLVSAHDLAGADWGELVAALRPPGDAVELHFQRGRLFQRYLVTGPPAPTGTTWRIPVLGSGSWHAVEPGTETVRLSFLFAG